MKFIYNKTFSIDSDTINVDQREIKFIENCQDLAIVFDSLLSFRFHVDYITQKLSLFMRVTWKKLRFLKHNHCVSQGWAIIFCRGLDKQSSG